MFWVSNKKMGHSIKLIFFINLNNLFEKMYICMQYASKYVQQKSRIDAVSTLFGWRPHKGQVNKKE